jgi:uncharacterized protein YbjT (DUF2867 family)
MTRTPDKAALLRGLGVEIVQGDLLEPASLTRACQGVEKVLAAAHSISGRGRQASKYVDLQGHQDLIDAAWAAGVAQFVYTSIYRYDPVYEAVPFFRIKYEVEAYLKASGMAYTILRPTAFMDSHAEGLIGQPILEKGEVTLIGKGANPRNFILADDVAQFAVMALEDPVLEGQTIDIGGPENLTNMEVVGIYEKLAGKRAKVKHLPLGILKIMFKAIRPVHPGLSQIIQAGIYTDTVTSSFNPVSTLADFPVVVRRLEDWATGRMR